MDPRTLPPGTRVIVYLRHSPGDNQTIDSQQDEVMQLVREKRWDLVDLFVDRWISGSSTAGRTDFERMIHFSKRKPRPADLLIIWSYSRFARNKVHAQLYRAQLRAEGWQILSMCDEIPGGELSTVFEALVDWKNEQALIDLKTDTKRGLRYIAEQGCVPGGRIPKGYRFEEKHIGTLRDGTPRFGRKPVIDQDIAPLIIKAFELKARGAPHEIIAEETDLYPPEAGTWNHFFRNRIYVGEFEYQDQVFTNVYPAIISRDLFDAVQKTIVPRQKRPKRKLHPRRRGSSYFLANLAVCAHCGGHMEGKGTKQYRYYICASRNKEVARCPGARLIPADALEEKVLSVLTRHVLTEGYLQDLLEWTTENLNLGLEDLALRIKKISGELAAAHQTATKMARNFLLMDKMPTSAQTVLQEQERQVRLLREELTALEEEYGARWIPATPEQITAYVHQTRDLIAKGEFYDLRDVCERLCSRLIISDTECRIELHFPEI